MIAPSAKGEDGTVTVFLAESPNILLWGVAVGATPVRGIRGELSPGLVVRRPWVWDREVDDAGGSAGRGSGRLGLKDR